MYTIYERPTRRHKFRAVKADATKEEAQAWIDERGMPFRTWRKNEGDSVGNQGRGEVT